MNFFGFPIDFWTIWGFLSQFVFFLSFAVQWYLSEKKKKSYLPIQFWYLRILGSLMLVFYIFHRKDIVFLTAVFLQIIIYLRNIILMRKND